MTVSRIIKRIFESKLIGVRIMGAPHKIWIDRMREILRGV